MEITANLPYCKAAEIHLGVNFLINASQKVFCYWPHTNVNFLLCPFVIYTRPPCGVKAQGLPYLPQFSSARRLSDADKIKIEITNYYEQILRSVSYQNTSILLCAAEFTFSLVRKLNSFFIQFALHFFDYYPFLSLKYFG